MWSNFSLALTTLLSVLLISFLWAIAVFEGGASIPLARVDSALALRNLMFCLAAFWLLCVVAYLPIRRSVIIRLLVGTGLIFFGAWQELLRTLVISPWFVARWIEIVALPGGSLITALGLYQLGKAYQLNRLLLGSYRSIERKLATVDQLTQVYNRRYFFSVGPDLMHALDNSSKHRHSEHGPVIVLLKIANLPDINQAFGFLAGDTVLAHTGRSIHRYLRTQDITARLSGRTFAIFLPDAAESEAAELAQRLVDLSRHLLLHDQNGEEVSCTIDFKYTVCRAERGESFEQLLSRTKMIHRQRHTHAERSEA